MAIVGVIGDTHCPGMKEGYIDFLKETFKSWGVNRVVHIGDLVDWNSISYHEKHPSNSNASTEEEEAKKQVQQLVKAFPDVDWLIGNHDDLPNRKAVSSGLPVSVLKNYLKLWGGIPWRMHPRYYKLMIDGVLYCHGDTSPGGEHAAIKHAKLNFKSTVLGHNHSNGGVSYYANEKFRVFGMDVGCGVDADLLQFEYGRKFPRKPILGCGIVIDGRAAYFEPWQLKSR